MDKSPRAIGGDPLVDIGAVFICYAWGKWSRDELGAQAIGIFYRSDATGRARNAFWACLPGRPCQRLVPSLLWGDRLDERRKMDCSACVP